jgi:serine/threonine-protein kinase
MSEEDPLIGQLVAGRYRVVKRLGEGGMGEVYLGMHEAIEKKVALKVLRREYSQKPDIVTRFQQEAISASRIKHPNVLDVFDFGQLDNGCFFLAMEFLEGNDLADELLRARVLDPVRGLQIALQICRALAAAHGKGVVHRDMKPENVFLMRTADGEEIVKVVDFGIAQLRTTEEAAASEPKRRRLTKTGMIFGTPEYMAPEQAAGKRADHRVDVYAVGIILFEIFTGAVPFTGDTFMAVLAAHLNDEAPPMTQVAPDLAISPQLQLAIMRALKKKPEERYGSMNEFAQALIATPEAAGLGPMTRMPSLGDQPMSQLAQAGGAGAHTAAQFSRPGAPAGHDAHTAAYGTGATPGSVAQPAAAAQYTPAGQHAQGGPRVTGGQFAPAAGPVTPGPITVGAQTLEPSDATRAPTHIATEAPVRPPEPKSRLALVLGLVAFVVLGGGAAVIAVTRVRGDVVAQPELTAPTGAGAATAPPTVPATAPPASASAAPAGPSDRIKLTVVTDPPGAMVSKDGFQVCDSSPCEVLAAPNETLELSAKKGAATGKAKVLAQKDQTVSIKLAAAAGPKPTGGPKMCEVNVDGLKILRPCP